MANKFNTKHGMTGTRVYDVWINMKQRCLNPNYRSWKNYGGRGIKVHDAWVNDFQAFMDHVGLPSFDNAQIDRIDNNGNYEPGNVRWVTCKQNGRNKGNNRIVTHNGKTATLAEICEDYGLKESHIIGRMNLGHSLEDALKMPLRSRSKRKVYPFNGQMMTPESISKCCGFDRSLVGRRLRLGWTIEEATQTPAKHGQKLHDWRGNCGDRSNT